MRSGIVTFESKDSLGVSVSGSRTFVISSGGHWAAVTACMALMSLIQIAWAWFQTVPSDAWRFFTDLTRSSTSHESHELPWHCSGLEWGFQGPSYPLYNIISSSIK